MTETEQNKRPPTSIPISDAHTALAWVRHHLDQIRDTAAIAADGCHQVDGDVVIISRRELAALVRDARRPAEQWEAVLDEERHGAGLVERASDALAKIDAAIASADPKSTVQIADVAHVVRNALVPAQVQIERLQVDLEHDLDEERTRRFQAAETAIATVLAYVDRLVSDAQKENP